MYNLCALGMRSLEPPQLAGWRGHVENHRALAKSQHQAMGMCVEAIFDHPAPISLQGDRSCESHPTQSQQDSLPAEPSPDC